MTEKDILNLIRENQWMMGILQKAKSLGLKDWMIGAGSVRNMVWNHLSGNLNQIVDTRDIDLVYYDKEGNDESGDIKLSQRMQQETGIEWEIVNEYYAHVWNDMPPYLSTIDAISKWPETVTAIGVTLDEMGELKLIAPYGIDDLVNFIVRPTPNFKGGIDAVRERVSKKGWLKKWPNLKLVL